jgi:hypothetical protein
MHRFHLLLHAVHPSSGGIWEIGHLPVLHLMDMLMATDGWDKTQKEKENQLCNNMCICITPLKIKPNLSTNKAVD